MIVPQQLIMTPQEAIQKIYRTCNINGARVTTHINYMKRTENKVDSQYTKQPIIACARTTSPGALTLLKT
jgi:hypothetical protein